MQRRMLWTIVSVMLALACGPGGGASVPAGSAPATGNAPAVSAPAADAAYRQQVVDAARAEGEVNATIQTTFTPDTIQRLEDAIYREYGVRLKINFAPVGNYPQRAGELFGELGANTRPSYDLYQSSDATSAIMR